MAQPTFIGTIVLLIILFEIFRKERPLYSSIKNFDGTIKAFEYMIKAKAKYAFAFIKLNYIFLD